MATWQYSGFLVQRTLVDKRLGVQSTFLGRHTFESGIWWENVEAGWLLQMLASSGVASRKVDDELFLAGDETSNCVWLTTRYEQVHEVYFRIDLRENADGFMATVLNIAVEYKALILGEGGCLVEPDQSALVAELKRSPAFKFVVGPREFLDASS